MQYYRAAMPQKRNQFLSYKMIFLDEVTLMRMGTEVLLCGKARLENLINLLAVIGFPCCSSGKGFTVASVSTVGIILPVHWDSTQMVMNAYVTST